MRALILVAGLFFSCCRDGPGKDEDDAGGAAEETSAREWNGFPDNAKATVSLNSGFVRASGVFINREGDILTSLHLVPEGADPMHIQWGVSDRTRSFGAESLYWDKQLDIMVLRSGVRSECYARLAGSSAARERSGVYLVGRFEKGIMRFYGKYLGEAPPFASSRTKVSNFLLPSARFSSGGGIFASDRHSLLGINRLVVNESRTSAPVSGTTIGDIKLFLKSHRINFEEVN